MSGLAEFVVHDALELMVQVPSLSSLSPTKIVAPFGASSLTGAVMTTRFAPAVMCACDFRNCQKYQ